MCANTTVLLNIDDSNDEVPQFDFTPYQVDVCEDYTIMTTVVQPVATDADSGSNAELTYSLQVCTYVRMHTFVCNSEKVCQRFLHSPTQQCSLCSIA